MDFLEYVKAAHKIGRDDPEWGDAFTHLAMELYGVERSGKEAVRLYMIIEGIRGMPESVSDLWFELRKL